MRGMICSNGWTGAAPAALPGNGETPKAAASKTQDGPRPRIIP
jgi:hypothetical protein